MPVFNDKHLSWKWEWAKEMVDTSRELKFPFLAGSSLPVTWRMPAIDMPLRGRGRGGAVRRDRRRGQLRLPRAGDDPVHGRAAQGRRDRRGRACRRLRGDAVWKAMEAGAWAGGGWDPQLFEACLCRSQTLAQPPTFSHRYPTPAQMREWVKDPVAYRFEYADGLKATMLLMNGLVGDFTFAARLKGQNRAALDAVLPAAEPERVYSAALMSKAEEMFLTGKAPYPIERTLLTSGLVAAGMQSLGDRPEAARNAAPRGQVRGGEGVTVLADVNLHGERPGLARPCLCILAIHRT